MADLRHHETELVTGFDTGLGCASVRECHPSGSDLAEVPQDAPSGNDSDVYAVRLVLALVAVVVPLLAGWTPTTATAGTCPVNGAPARQPGSVSAVIAEAARAIPRLYGSMTNQAGPGAWRGFEVKEAVALSPDAPPIPGAATLRAEVMRRCGAAIANTSWAVRVDFPEAPTAFDGYGVVIVSRTRQTLVSWRLR